MPAWERRVDPPPPFHASIRVSYHKATHPTKPDVLRSVELFSCWKKATQGGGQSTIWVWSMYLMWAPGTQRKDGPGS